MSESQRATEIVHDAIQRYADRGATMRASADALEALSATGSQKPAAPPATRAALPSPAPLPAEPSAQPKRKLTEMFAAELSAVSPVETPAPPPAATTPAPTRAPAIFTPAPGATEIAPKTGTKAERLAAMRGPVLACVKCPNLVKSRTQVVFGVGNPEAELMFVGEAPGADEDRVGEPFVGRAGQLLTKMIEAMNLTRADVYIGNVLKCRPDMPPGESGNRKPTGPEMATCKPYLMEQINIIQPRVLVALGATGVEGLLGIEKAGITRMRGQWRDFHGIPLMPTFHPSFLLRPTSEQLANKRLVWEDMMAVLEKLGHPVSEKQRGFFLSAAVRR